MLYRQNRDTYRTDLYRKTVPAIIDHGKGFLLEFMLPVHETAISDTVFPVPLSFGNLGIAVDTFADDPAPLFGADI